MSFKLNADKLRKWKDLSADGGEKPDILKQEIYIIVDNVLDTYNIGSVFRLADAVAAKRIYLCGGSETPPNHRIKKASINTTEWVDWEYFETTVEAINKLRSQVSNVQVIAIEQNEKSVPFEKFDYQLPVALIVGHESDGVSKEVLDLCDGIVELPMFGVNISLNVMVTLGIVLYKIVENIEHLTSN